jgi:hypothetical protein
VHSDYLEAKWEAEYYYKKWLGKELDVS